MFEYVPRVCFYAHNILRPADIFRPWTADAPMERREDNPFQAAYSFAAHNPVRNVQTIICDSLV